MRFDDLLHVALRHEAVPNGLGINDHRDPMFALIQAARDVDANAAMQTVATHPILQGLAHRFRSLGPTTAPRMPFRPLVRTNKNVMLE